MIGMYINYAWLDPILMKQDRLLSIHNTLTPLQRCDVSTRTAHWAITVLISNEIFIDLMKAQKLLLHSHCCLLCMKITFITMFTREVLLSSDNYVAHRSSKLPLFSAIYTCVVPWHIRKLEIDITKLLDECSWALSTPFSIIWSISLR